VWRWHFYAGLLVLPLLIWLAATGGIYLFKDAVDDWAHAALRQVQPPARPGALAAPSTLAAAALQAQPGQLLRYQPAAGPQRSAELLIATPQGQRHVVYVDPYRVQVLGSLPEGGSLALTVRKLHSLKLLGPWARALIEISAGWTLLLVLSGLYLWWPRGRSGGVLSVRGHPRRRVFWRDLHAVLGLGIGAVLFFLALTGLPWSVYLGQQINHWANGRDLGYPAGVRVQLPLSDQTLAELGPTSWSLQQARLPQSAPPSASPGHEDHQAHVGHATTSAPSAATLGLDAIMDRVQALGMAPGYSLSLPRGPQGVYTASVYPAELIRQRVVHLDQYSGQVLLDMGYPDYGTLGRGLEWGINIHLGQQWGAWNRWGLALACLLTVLMALSAGVMWWKRRPQGGLAVPPLPADRRPLRGVLALMVLAGLLMPLMGASLLLMLALDRWWLGRLAWQAQA
jgi:uncharacterized iron-regulated membrane protein